MDRVLIVDDEPFYRQSFSRIIDWQALDLTVPEEAINGSDALDKITSGGFDLVITDIKMPRMNGLELIRRAAVEVPECRFIVLSAFNEFALVKEAFKLGAVDYLLKHQISQEAVEHSVLRFREKQVNRRDPVLQERSFMTSFLLNAAGTLINPAQIAEVLGVPSDSEGGRIYAARGILHSQGAAAAGGEPERKTKPMEELPGEAASVFPEIYVHRNGRELTLFLVSAKPLLWQALDSRWASFHSFLQEHWGSVSIGFALPGDSFHSLSSSLQEASLCLSHFATRGKGSIISLPRIHDAGKTSEFPVLENLSRDIVEKSPENSERIIRALTLNPAEYRSCSPDLVRLYFSRTLAHLVTASEMMHLQDHPRLSCLFSAIGGDAANWDLEDFNSFLSDIAGFFSSMKTVENPVIGSVIEYLHIHYAEPLTLAEVADHFQVHPSYLSRLFTRVAGTGFARYLAEVRIRAAVKLMDSTAYRVSELADLVGISQPETFCRVFKRIMGMSPSSYVQSRGKKLTD